MPGVCVGCRPRIYSKLAKEMQLLALAKEWVLVATMVSAEHVLTGFWDNSL